MIQSDLLAKIIGLRHGFTTKNTPAHTLQILDQETTTARQVHQASLIWPATYEKKCSEADSLASFQKNFPIGVYSADCAPVLVVACDANQQAQGILAIHAGWRGTALKITEKSLRAFYLATQKRLEMPRYFAAIGPCISFASFEVGEEVIEAFPEAQKRGLAKFLRIEGEKRKFLFDLPGENARQLHECAQELGFPLTLDLMPYCTVVNTSLFPSFRRDRENAGRILSFLSLVRPDPA